MGKPRGGRGSNQFQVKKRGVGGSEAPDAGLQFSPAFEAEELEPVPATAGLTWQQAATHRQARIRAETAADPAAPPEALAQLVDDRHRVVRRIAIRHPAVPEHIKNLDA